VGRYAAAISTADRPERIIGPTPGECKTKAAAPGRSAAGNRRHYMPDLLSLDLGPFVVIMLILATVIGSVLYALYKGINRLLAFLEKHDV